MASTIQQAKIAGLAAYFPSATRADLLKFEDVYELNRHRVYALAFWMTDNELAAEDLMRNVFIRVFASSLEPTTEIVDRALITELREISPLGVLTLRCGACNQVLNVRRNILRTHLERAVVQVPRTERLAFLLHDVEGYDHIRIGKLLGLNEAESHTAVHQARLRIRELVAQMN